MFREFGDPRKLYDTMADEVFPFIKALGDGNGQTNDGQANDKNGENATYSAHMKDARFTIPTPALLAKVVDQLDAVPMDERPG